MNAIWIRTQDKLSLRLVESFRVEPTDTKIEQSGGFAARVPDENGRYSIIGEREFRVGIHPLGIYKDKETALKVLRDIEGFIFEECDFPYAMPSESKAEEICYEEEDEE